jgi:hypothetical protein
MGAAARARAAAFFNHEIMIAETEALYHLLLAGHGAPQARQH